VARQIAMCTYRSRASLEARFSRDGSEGERVRVEAGSTTTGRTLVDRFDAATYVALTKAMDTHDVGGAAGAGARR